jgi:hypothetical protein
MPVFYSRLGKSTITSQVMVDAVPIRHQHGKAIGVAGINYVRGSACDSRRLLNQVPSQSYDARSLFTARELNITSQVIVGAGQFV